MFEKLAPDNAALFEEDAVVAAGAAVGAVVDCKWIASMDVNYKVEVSLCMVAFDCILHLTGALASHSERVSGYLRDVLWVEFEGVAC